jgi:hypothetical protein
MAVMARTSLYHITPTRNLESILATGLEPRAGRWADHEWPARVWLTNSRNSAIWIASAFLIQRKFDGIDYGSVDPSPIWDRSLSILRITRFPVNQNDHRVFRGHILANKLMRATLWTAEHIDPSVIISHEKIIPDVHFQDASYRRYIGQPAAVARQRLEESEPLYLPIYGKVRKSGKQQLLGVKRNPHARRTRKLDSHK